jgi:chromosome segregation ATPase
MLGVAVLIQDVREELQRESEQNENDRSAHELRLADESTRNATLELDLKACNRQLTRAKDECERIRSKWDHAQNKLLELASESEGLREQLKQKETLIFSSHNTLSMKYVVAASVKLQVVCAQIDMNDDSLYRLREERAIWERDQASLKVRSATLVSLPVTYLAYC